MFVLNPQSGKPLYRQLVDQVRRMIVNGNLKVGETLPSVRALAEAHAVNPMTISKAYALLESEGLLERNPGKPMTVASLRSQGETQGVPESLVGPMRKLIVTARDLDLDKNEAIAMLEKFWEKD
jgi:GntR family transcriptional regulator